MTMSKDSRLQEEVLEAEERVGGPTSWRLIGLVALAAVILVLLIGQMMGGNKGTDVIPGTPVAAPQAASQ